MRITARSSSEPGQHTKQNVKLIDDDIEMYCGCKIAFGLPTVGSGTFNGWKRKIKEKERERER